MIDLEDEYVTCLIEKTLAYPTGLCLDEDEKNLYVCELFRNRILRVNLND